MKDQKAAEAQKLNLFQKLIQVKNRVSYLQKDEKGYGFTYASPTAVLSAINPVLNEVGVMLIPEVESEVHQEIAIETKNGAKVEWLWTLKMKFTWVNVDNPQERETVPWMGSGCNGQEQGFGSALTYAERYFLLKFFNIPTDKDDPDGFDKRIQKTVSRPQGGRKRAQDPRSQETQPVTPAEDPKVVEALKESYMAMVMEWMDLFTQDEYDKFSKTSGWGAENFKAAFKHVHHIIRERDPNADLAPLEEVYS